MAWSFIENYDKNSIDINNITNYIRKPRKFNIENSEFHGITTQIAKKEGLNLSIILKYKGLSRDIMNCDYIVAHNALFDIHILLNEAHRLNFNNLIERIL